MRRHLLFLLSLIFSLSAFTQNGQKIDSIVWSHYLSESNEWIPFTKSIVSYNEDGLIILSESSNMDTITGSWQVQTRIEHIYDQNGVEISAIGTSLVESVWDTNYRYLYFYDQHGNDTLFVQENWNTMENHWKNGLKKHFDYDSLNRNIAFDICLWNEGNAMWDSISKCQIFYNSSGKDSLQLYRYLQNNEWVYTNRFEKYYDENGNDTLLLQYGFDLDIKKIYGKTLFEFDEIGNRISEINYSFFSETWHPVYKREYDWNEFGNYAEIRNFEFVDETQVMELKAREKYFYKLETATNIKEVTSLIVYPNPAKDYIKITNKLPGAFIELYDLNGTRVLHQKLSGDRVYIGLQKGIYLYRVIKGQDHQTGKIRVE